MGEQSPMGQAVEPSIWVDFWLRVGSSAVAFVLTAALAVALYLWKRRDDLQRELVADLMDDIYDLVKDVTQDPEFLDYRQSQGEAVRDYYRVWALVQRMNYFEYRIKNSSVKHMLDAFGNNLLHHTVALTTLESACRLHDDVYEEYRDAVMNLLLVWPDHLAQHLDQRKWSALPKVVFNKIGEEDLAQPVTTD